MSMNLFIIVTSFQSVIVIPFSWLINDVYVSFRMQFTFCIGRMAAVLVEILISDKIPRALKNGISLEIDTRSILS